ncbi:hypothetical protein ACR3K2_24240 [Cryptosporidium serpentis]
MEDDCKSSSLENMMQEYEKADVTTSILERSLPNQTLKLVNSLELSPNITNGSTAPTNGEIQTLKKKKQSSSKDKAFTIKTILDKHVTPIWLTNEAPRKLIPTLENLENQLETIISRANLNDLTLRKLYGILSLSYNVNMTSSNVPNIEPVVRKIVMALKSSQTANSTQNQTEKRRYKRIKEKRVLVNSLAEFMDGDKTASLMSCAIKIKHYCEENHLSHPSNAKLFLIDETLRKFIPNRDSIGKQVNSIFAVLKQSNVEIIDENGSVYMQNVESEDHLGELSSLATKKRRKDLQETIYGGEVNEPDNINIKLD